MAHVTTAHDSESANRRHANRSTSSSIRRRNTLSDGTSPDRPSTARMNTSETSFAPRTACVYFSRSRSRFLDAYRFKALAGFVQLGRHRRAHELLPRLQVENVVDAKELLALARGFEHTLRSYRPTKI